MDLQVNNRDRREALTPAPRELMDIAFLGQYSDAMREDVQRVVREVLKIAPDSYLVEKLEPKVDKDTGNVAFYGNGQVDCEVVSGFVNLMRRRLPDELKRDISRLRTQYRGLHHYFSEMSKIKRGDGFIEGFRIIEEMERGDLFGEPIMPNKLIIDILMCSLRSFDEAEQVYKYVAERGYYEFDTVFFQLWRCYCTEPSHVRRIFEAAKLAGQSENLVNEVDL